MKTLLLFLSLTIVTAIAVAQPSAQTVTFTTGDGVVITGTLYASSKVSAPTVLCLHQWRSDRSSYAGLATSLQTAGYTVLAIDLRGYGGSTKNSRGKAAKTQDALLAGTPFSFTLSDGIQKSCPVRIEKVRFL